MKEENYVLESSKGFTPAYAIHNGDNPESEQGPITDKETIQKMIDNSQGAVKPQEFYDKLSQIDENSLLNKQIPTAEEDFVEDDPCQE